MNEKNDMRDETTQQRLDVSEVSTKWRNRGKKHWRQEF